MVHFCYSGTSGSSRVALNISRGSAQPERHAYVFYGVEPLREDYADELRARGCNFAYVPKKLGLDLACYKAAAAAIAAMQPQAVIFHGSRTAPVAWRTRRLLRGARIVAVQHGPEEELAGGPRRWACLALSYLADFTVAVSPSLMELLGRGWFSRRVCPSGRMRVILNGVDEEFWGSEARDARTGPSFAIGMIGTLATYKDQPTLIGAVGRLRGRGVPVRLELAGAGPREGALRAMARSEGLADVVKFLGDLSQAALREAMAGWDVLAHSTHSEGLSMALLEGMMAGMPIVASDVPGVRQAVENLRTGLLVPPGDSDALAAAIAGLLENHVSAAQLGAAARARALEHFSMRRMAREYEEIADLGPPNSNY